jgi:mRNA interferase MazF
MEIKQWYFYLAYLNPQKGTLAGKVRPVLVIQSNSLNKNNHPSTIVLPLTSNVVKNAKLLRLNITHTNKNELTEDSDIMIDQIIAIDNKRFLKEIGKLENEYIPILKEYLLHVIGW